jgi:hypothetical protein
MFSGNFRGSYWIQYSKTLGTSIKFINNQSYNIFWSHTFNSYYTEAEHYIDKPEELGLGTLAEFLKVQGIIEGKKRGRKENLSTQGSSKYPALKRTKEGGSSPIQESISNSGKGSEELTRSLKLSAGITPTPDNPQTVMSYATTIARTFTTISPGGAGPFLTVGVTGEVPNWPASSEGYQIAQGSRSGQAEGSGHGQGAAISQLLGKLNLDPLGGPDPPQLVETS